MPRPTWVLESLTSPGTHSNLRGAVERTGQVTVSWKDDWWDNGRFPKLEGSVVFHGSLGNADRIERELDWRPGGFCDTAAFCCSAWYAAAGKHLLHDRYHIMSAVELVEQVNEIAQSFGAGTRLFVPLKPFSGRVVDVAGLTLEKLDFGFYFDDPMLPVVAAPVREVGREWRFVVADGEVVTGSAYDAITRTAIAVGVEDDAARFAADVASMLPSPAPVYVMDVCEADGAFHLLELNPFGGADLYACNAKLIVEAVSALA